MESHVSGAPESTVGPDARADSPATKKKARRSADPTAQKRRCVSTACIACRRRKSKCDGAVPSCAACASVYGTDCVYDPNSDHRRKGVYREKGGTVKARNTTLHVLLDAIINAPDTDVHDLVQRIRTADSLDGIAETILNRQEAKLDDPGNVDPDDDNDLSQLTTVGGERDLARKMGELRLENGSVRFIGGTSHLIYLGAPTDSIPEPDMLLPHAVGNPITTWTNVTKDPQLIVHLVNLYFNWHYTYFTTLSKRMFYQEFLKGVHPGAVYCSPLLVNAILALGCHFTSVPGACAVQGDSRTKGDHFFAEAKRLIVENDEYEKPRLTTVQALALMSVREAGCAREAKGWVYSGMSFRMAQDMGLNFDTGSMAAESDRLGEHEVDARRVTFWGGFLFDKCWSNYMGRLPQIPQGSYNVPKYDVFPDEDAELWSPYTDRGFDQSSEQPSRTRAIGLELLKLCEISSDLLIFFYHPNHIGRSSGKAVELKKLSELHRRLEEWRKELPKEFEPKDGQLPNVILTHMFFHLQYIHLFRPFLKYTPAASPLPSHVSPRRICTANAVAISKLIRLYKKTWNLRQICNIAVYMVHSACTIHLLNLPEKTARRDIIHGVKHLEEIAEDWLCARRSLGILSVLSRKWACEMPDEARVVLQRTDDKYGTFSTAEVPSPSSNGGPIPSDSPSPDFPPSSSIDMSASSRPEGYPSMMAYDHLAAADHLMRRLPGPPLPSSSGGGGGGNPLGIPVTQQQLSAALASITNQDPIPSSGATDWSSLRTTATVPNYGARPAFSPMARGGPGAGTRSPVTSAQTSRSATRQVSPSSMFLPQHRQQRQQRQQQHDQAIDGQHWYLNDGVRWHQNFESWDLPLGSGNGPAPRGQRGSGHASSPLLAEHQQQQQQQQQQQPPQQHQFTFRSGSGGAGPSAGGGGGAPGAGVSAAGRMSVDEASFAGFDALAALSGSAWLSGLD